MRNSRDELSRFYYIFPAIVYFPMFAHAECCPRPASSVCSPIGITVAFSIKCNTRVGWNIGWMQVQPFTLRPNLRNPSQPIVKVACGNGTATNDSSKQKKKT